MHFLRLDPGGVQCFGWAMLHIQDSQLIAVRTGTSSSARAAVSDAWQSSDARPCAVGIDAPLFWVHHGDRNADLVVRRLYRDCGGHSATVAHVNSLRGACLVQGILAAIEVEKRSPGILITEAHPKALLKIAPSSKAFLESYPHTYQTEHEYDAAIAAFSAWAALKNTADWHNLVAIEKEPYFPTGRDVLYWFPRGRA